jgi:S-formylglutathione hydrolase FrmB
MAFIQAHFWSEALKKQVACFAIVPQKGRGPFPVCYLLHGRSDDHTIWLRRTRIETYAEKYPLIVVMPDGFRGFYTDNENGPAYGQYMIEDVLGFAERTLPALGKREGRCIGGLSMGGYGAMRLALAHPDKFVSANSHSGAVNLFRGTPPAADIEMRNIFGRQARGTDHDLRALIRKARRARRRLPKLRIDCGVEDFLIQQNRQFHAFLAKQRVAHEYVEYPGSHSWDYWDLHVREALDFPAQALGIRG